MSYTTVKLKNISVIKTGKLDSNAAVLGGQYPFFTCDPNTLQIDKWAYDTEAVLLAGNNASGNYTAKYYKGKFNAYQRVYIIESANADILNIRYRFVVNDTYSTSFTRIAKAGSILFSVRAPVGRLNFTKDRIVIGRGLAAINHRQGLQSYLFYLLKNRFFKDDIIGNGSIFASISKDDLLNQKLLVPDNTLAVQFNSIAYVIDKKISCLSEQIRFLTEARDRLLPKLMSEED